MNVSIEFEAGSILAVYFSLRQGKVARTIEAGNGVQVDQDRNGTVLGVEMLNPAKVNIVERIGRKRHIPELTHARRDLRRAFRELLPV